MSLDQLNLSGLVEKAIEERYVQIQSRSGSGPRFDTKSISLASMAISLKRIADFLEKSKGD